MRRFRCIKDPHLQCVHRHFRLRGAPVGAARYESEEVGQLPFVAFTGCMIECRSLLADKEYPGVLRT
jgi:hypothetical protein